MYSIIHTAHAAEEAEIGRELLNGYLNATCSAATSVCHASRNTLLDLNNATGTWSSPYLFSKRLNQIAATSCFTVVLLSTLVTLAPFVTFRRDPVVDAHSDLTDTALCFHINRFNQTCAVMLIKGFFVAFLVASSAFILAIDQYGGVAFRATHAAILTALLSTANLFPYTVYNRMTYADYQRIFLADDKNARLDELSLADLALLLLVKQSKLRVLEAVSMQSHADDRDEATTSNTKYGVNKVMPAELGKAVQVEPPEGA